MSNSLSFFAFDLHQVRVYTIDGAHWFAASDVCLALDIINHKQAVGRLDKDESAVLVAATVGGTQKMLFLSEAGLYSLVLSSRKPDAARFKRWVTHEVLPAIRQTGQYVHATKPVAKPTKALAAMKPRIRTRDDLSFTHRDALGRLINWPTPAARPTESDEEVGARWFGEVAELAAHDPISAQRAVVFAAAEIAASGGNYAHVAGFFGALAARAFPNSGAVAVR